MEAQKERFLVDKLVFFVYIDEKFDDGGGITINRKPYSSAIKKIPFKYTRNIVVDKAMIHAEIEEHIRLIRDHEFLQA